MALGTVFGLLWELCAMVAGIWLIGWGVYSIFTFNKKKIIPNRLLIIVKILGGVLALAIPATHINFAYSNVVESNKYKNTIEGAVKHNQYDNLKRLLEEGNDPDGMIKSYSTPLMAAVSTPKNYEMAKLLLKYGANVNFVNKYGGTPLLSACGLKHDNLDNLKLLVDNGARINYQDKNGLSSLMEACKAGAFLNTQYLVQNGADINVKYLDIEYGRRVGYTALFMAIDSSTNYKDILSWKEKGKTWNNGILEIYPDNTKIAELLLNEGANIDYQSEDGTTALMLACKANNYEIITLLVQKGADKTLTDKRNNTALNYAIEECMNLLL